MNYKYHNFIRQIYKVTGLLSVMFAITALLFTSAYAQETDLREDSQESEEVLLSFNYRVVGQVYVTTLYDPQTDRIYLPVSELFSLLEIDHQIKAGQFSIKGTYLHPDNSYSIDFQNYSASYNDQTFVYDKSQFNIGELDYFLDPGIFEDLFGMYFDINMNTLTLSLQADDTMPVVERLRRERERNRMENQSFVREDYPLLYDRNRSVLTPGFLDYSVSTMNMLNERQNYYNYSFMGGIEFLGGDLQGAHVGGFNSSGNRYYHTRDLRWRYVIRDNPYISKLSGGQVRTNGLQSREIRGVSVSNDPIEPRQLQGSHIVEGTAEPDSEVELYLNNTLIDYTRADGLGAYRFEVPLRYGTTRLRKQIYTPDGQVLVERERVRAPFQFLPPGVVTYNVEGGVVEPNYYHYLSGSPMVHGNVSMGLNNWLTAKVGTEYIRDINDHPFLYGSLSGRLFNQYLVNVDLAPDAFYRVQSSVIYPSSRNLSANYTHFTGPSIYNTQRANHLIEANFYSPLQLGGMSAGFRIGGEHLIFQHRSQTRYTGDLYFRMGQLNMRLNYLDNIFFSEDIRHGAGQLRGSATYILSRNQRLPSLLRGTYVRMSALYERSQNQFRRIDLQLSKSILNNGRMYIGASRDVQAGLTRIQAGLSINIGNSIRSSTDYRSNRNNHSIRQNFRGSIGFDETADRMTFSAREQAGRAAASVVLYADNNNSDTFDEGDDILPYAAVRLNRSSNVKIGGDGVIRLSQLRSYYRYNLDINRNAIPHPLLVPAVSELSFIADPNQYKRIEIPFYRAGVIEGLVSVQEDDTTKGTGGIRLLLEGIDHEYSEVIRTFHGGGFYAMDVPPGRYTLQVDPAQLELLNREQRDGIYKFEIEPLAEGDFQEGIEIVLIPKRDN